MFAESIREAGEYTRPIHLITKTYESPQIIAESATIFFVNDTGAAVTARHVAEGLIRRQNVERDYAEFKQKVAQTEGAKGRRAAIKQLERESGYKRGVATHAKTRFVDCFDRITSMTFHLHPTYDIAIIQFEWEGEKRYNGHAVFAENREYVQPGDFLCRLGFPFSEFDDFAYDGKNDTLDWTQEGRVASPRFPLDGMVTRFLASKDGIYGIEMSTPGFAGQAGGPLFDEDGIVCGMQFATNHLHLGYDINGYRLVEGGVEKQVSGHPFMHVGQCVDAETIKAFLTEHKVDHYVDQ